jgi:hypothetical protein
MRHFLASILTPIVLFCAAVPSKTVPPDYLITKITVSCPDHSPAPLEFADQQTMGQILAYLRTVPLLGQADTGSMDFTLPLYTVRLTHSTGRITEYHQLGTDYLSKNDSPWYHIAPEDGRFLIAFFPNSLYNE